MTVSTTSDVNNGVIVNAKIEKRYKRFRVISSIYLVGNHYRLKDIIVTNKSVFSSTGVCSIEKSVIGDNESYTQEVADNVIPPIKGAKEFISSSCQKLSALDRLSLESLKDFINDKGVLL